MYSEFEDQYLRIQPFKPKAWDAWRRGPYGETCFMVDTTIVERLANPARLFEVSRDVERLTWIQQAMKDRGLDEPLVLVVDRAAGRIALKDGHHRLLCASGLLWPRLPCRLIVSDRIRSHGLPIADVLGTLLT